VAAPDAAASDISAVMAIHRLIRPTQHGRQRTWADEEGAVAADQATKRFTMKASAAQISPEQYMLAALSSEE